MLEPSLAMLVAVTLELTTVYWACLVLGGGVLLISAFGGGHHDADLDVGGHVDLDACTADVDFDIDVDAAMHADVGPAGDVASTADAAESALSLASWLSIRFAVFFVATFGAVGVVLTHMTTMGRGVVLAFALASGGAVGQGVHQAFRYLRRTSGNSAPQPRDYVHKLARVTIPIADAKKGEIALQVRDARRHVPAVARTSHVAFAAGDEVVVVGYRAGIAEVVSPDEYEALTHTGQGG
ncbi:MAG: hypothetical protein GY842_26420 [bacterium]|nr:hypothetical protein [bacterium]